MAAKYPDTTRISVMTDSEKIIKIVRSGLEVNDILDSSLHTICIDPVKEGNVIISEMSYHHLKNIIFSTHGIFEETG